MTELSEEYGVRFTEVYSPSFGTRKGQPAVFCSLYTFDDQSVMNLAPSSNLKCLGSIFKEKNYQTGFFYPSSNRFDNQITFYQKNDMDLIHGEENISKDQAKGGWGFSDHALFDHLHETLKDMKQPFFSMALTLTNHGPYLIPDDVPKNLIKKDLPLKTHQIAQYVDWALYDLFIKIKKNFPHTLFIIAADEGKSDIKFSKPPTIEQIRRNARIPFTIISPKIPKELAGYSSKSFGIALPI